MQEDPAQKLEEGKCIKADNARDCLAPEHLREAPLWLHMA